MDGSLFLLGLLVLGFAVVIPVVAIVAYRRTGALRAAIDQQQYENSDSISTLRGEVASLQRTVDELTRRLKTTEEAGRLQLNPWPNPSCDPQRTLLQSRHQSSSSQRRRPWRPRLLSSRSLPPHHQFPLYPRKRKSPRRRLSRLSLRRWHTRPRPRPNPRSCRLLPRPR